MFPSNSNEDWWDGAAAAGPKERPHASFSEPVPTLSLLATEGDKLARLACILVAAFAPTWAFIVGCVCVCVPVLAWCA